MMNKKTLMVIMGNLTAFGPFVTDFYLPCLPEMTGFFDVPASGIQTSLTAGMLGLAVGQIFIGPIADKYGRKRPLLWCLLMFVLATVGCILSTGIYTFITFRLLQGLTGAAGLVISKAIVADTFSERDLAKAFAVLAAVQGTAPIVAPVLGGAAYSLTSWQGAFAVLGIWALLLLFACRKLGESLAVGDRIKLPLSKSLVCYVPVFRNGRYMTMNLLQSFAAAALIAYVSVSPFIFQNHFGLTPMQYSVIFAVNSLGLVAGSTLVMKLPDLVKATDMAVAGLTVTSLAACACLVFELHIVAFEIFLILMLFCIGMITPSAITRALNAAPENKGVASALVGSIPFLLGGILAPLTGMGNKIHSVSIIIIGCVAICLVLNMLSRRIERKHAAASGERS